ncbi:MAG: hypothetical protein ACR2QJ_07215 [Geminicoccaceae bacterium]
MNVLNRRHGHPPSSFVAGLGIAKDWLDTKGKANRRAEAKFQHVRYRGNRQGLPGLAEGSCCEPARKTWTIVKKKLAINKSGLMPSMENRGKRT